VARRPFVDKQQVEVSFDGERYMYEFDHKQLTAWFWFGISPVLEIENTVTGEKLWFQYWPSSSGHRWNRLRHGTGYRRWTSSPVPGFTAVPYQIHHPGGTKKPPIPHPSVSFGSCFTKNSWEFLPVTCFNSPWGRDKLAVVTFDFDSLACARG